MNNLFSVWQSVKVIDKDHERFGQAGTVWKEDKQGDLTVLVRFDSDHAEVQVQVEAVQVL